MSQPRRFPAAIRWTAPAAVVATAALVAGGTIMASAQAAPPLPARSAAQLLASIQGRAPAALPPMTAAITETANLGLPALPDVGGESSALSPLSLLSGSHTVRIWYADPAHVRIALPVPMGETDLYRNGRQVWLWQSSSQTATHLVLPAEAAAAEPLPAPAGQRTAFTLTPQQVARQVLAQVGPSTAVSVQRNVSVAGQAAYQLQIRPRDSRSLIGEIRIAVDAAHYLPLSVQVFARGATSPAFSVGYTRLSLGRPAPANFAFTAPAGAKVHQAAVPALAPGASSGAILSYGKLHRGALPAAAARQLRQRFLKNLPSSLTPAQRQAALRRFNLILQHGFRPGGQVPALKGAPAAGFWSGVAPGQVASRLGASAPQVLGKDWLSVVVLPAAAGLPVPVRVGANQASAATPSSGSAAYQSRLSVSLAGSGQAAALLSAALRAAVPVHGAWGHGRLLRTALVSVLLTSNGKILIGAVRPAVLFADAARVK